MVPRRGDGAAWAVVITSLALFMATLDNLVVTTALPVIRGHLHAGLAGLEWTVNAYTLTFAVLLLTGAALGDRFGRRRMFLAGLVDLHRRLGCRRAVAHGGLARHGARRAGRGRRADHAAVAHAALGRGAARAQEPGARGVGRHRRRGGGGGPPRGWGGDERVVVAVDLLDQRPRGDRAGGAGAVAPGRVTGPRQPLDLGGVVLATTGLLGTVLGSGAGQHPRVDERGGAELVRQSAPSGLAGFVAWELRSTHPMLPLRLFRSRSFAAVNVMALFMSFGMFGSIFFLSQFLQVVQHYSPLAAGLRVLPWTGMPMLVAPLAAALAQRFGGRPVLAAGLGAAGGRALRGSPSRPPRP